MLNDKVGGSMKESTKIAKVSMLAGKIMLESGAETHRVEDTMSRIAAAYGLKNAQSFATPTGLYFSIALEEATSFVRISNRGTDLHKISEVNDLSRQIAQGELTVEQALQKLECIDKAKLTFPSWLQILFAALVSGCFTIMFGGLWYDFIPAFLTGGVGFCVMLIVNRIVEIRFVADFVASFVIGLCAYVFIKTGYGMELDFIIIGSVMPLVPGLPITNAVRDLLAGHLIAGVSRGVEALLTAFAIGAGIALCFAFV